MIRILNILLALSLSTTLAIGQPHRSVTIYDEEDGVPSAHVTQLLQDDSGFMWFATWNGLCRFDGYEFQNFKPVAGDGCQMLTDRIRDIGLRPDGNILCRVDDSFFLFDLKSYRFRDLTKQQQQQAEDSVRYYRQSRSQGQSPDKDGITFTMSDLQGNLWALNNGRIYKYRYDTLLVERLAIEPQAEVKCLFQDRQGRYWITTKEDAAVRVYSSDGDWLLGFLGPDGRLHQQYTRFDSPVYCMYEEKDGTLWMGTKPGGLYRLKPVASDRFQIDHFTNLPNDNVYNIAADGFGRLWIATLGGGLCYTDNPQSQHPTFATPAGYGKEQPLRVRYLHITKNGVLMAATTDGLVVAKLEKNAKNIRFHRHQREPGRTTSLSSNATMDILETPDGHILVSTESGGINMIDGKDWLSNTLNFRHLNTANQGLPSDIVLSLAPMDKQRYIAVSGHMVMLTDTTGHYRVLDANYFNAAPHVYGNVTPSGKEGENTDFRFSEAHPLRLSDGRWLFGLTDGAFTTRPEQMLRQAYRPRLVLTRITVQGAESRWNAESMDTLTLLPDKRSVTVHFAALDYRAAEHISYAFRLMEGGRHDAANWNSIGHDRSATLLDLEPGTYCLEIRSTDANGEWQDNVRRLVIMVQPTFWESVWGRLLILLLIAATLAIVIYTLLYIRRIKRKQHETLEAYLQLLNKPVTEPIVPQEVRVPSLQVKPEDDAMLKRIMAFIEENIGNSEASVGDMATAAATSRSGLQRKLKQAMGITPQDLLREARIKHACLLLRQSDKTVAEVAYACGFSDPKYFSRSFKQSTGQSPTDYKNSHIP